MLSWLSSLSFCEDDNLSVAGAIAIDDTAPTLLMLYQDANSVYITLDEDSTCEYSNIPFEFGEGTTTSFLDTSHKIPAGDESREPQSRSTAFHKLTS